MRVNWWLLLVLAITALGGVGIGLTFSPRGGRRRVTWCVVRSWSRPSGLEILFESRSNKAAVEWRAAHRAEYGTVLYIHPRSHVYAENAADMANPQFWDDIQRLGDAWAELQETRSLVEELQAQLSQPPDLRHGGVDPALTIDRDVLREALSDTAELILAEIHRHGGIPEPGSVMPAMAPTESMPLGMHLNPALPARPAGVHVMKPTSKPGTQTVVIPLVNKRQ